MVNLYNENQIESLKKSKKKALIFIFVPLAVVLPLFVLFNILVSTKTKALYITLSSLLLAVYSINLVYQLLEGIIKNNDKIKHIKDVNQKQTKLVKGKIVSVSDQLTLKRNIKIREINIDVNGSPFRVYLNADFETQEFKINDVVKFTLAGNFIKEYEVINEK